MSKYRHRMAVAGHLLLSDDVGRVLFMRRANTGYADGQWSLPAGHVDRGETLVAACVREAAEELGVTVIASDLECVLVQHKHDLDGDERIDIFFAGKLPPGERVSIAEPDKCDALTWAALDQPPQPLIPYIHAALSAITASPTPFLNYFGFDVPTKADAAPPPPGKRQVQGLAEPAPEQSATHSRNFRVSPTPIRSSGPQANSEAEEEES